MTKHHDDEVRQLSLLIVDDEPIALKTMLRIARSEGYQIEGAHSFEEAAKLLPEKKYDIVLTDLMLGDASGFEVMDKAIEADQNTVLIIITGYASIDSAIEATRKGAFHYIQKPVRSDELRHILKRAAEKRQLVDRVLDLEQRLGSVVPKIIGKSPAIHATKNLITQLQHSDSTILITGESGTGKELVAQAIHNSSLRKQKPFVAINCGSLTDDLMSNELFGHEKEAFTGASKRVAGLIENADGGTVFLDEVGDMSSAMQAKILRVIQERELLRVGGSKPVPVDVRFLAATNKDLKKLVSAGIIREDLYYRLNVINIHLPSLTERREDIPLLAACFLNRYSKAMGRIIQGFSAEALEVLTTYSFPGNVRELENIIERAVSLSTGNVIQKADLPPDLSNFTTSKFQKTSSSLKTLQEMQMEYILWVLEQVDQNKTEAAKILGIDRVTLYRILKRRVFEE